MSTKLYGFKLIGVQYFEQDDPEFFLGKVKYLLDNDVLEMELTFSEEEYSTSGQLIKVKKIVE